MQLLAACGLPNRLIGAELHLSEATVKRHLAKHAQEIYKEALNSAEAQYGEESRAHRVARGAVENKYEKNEEGNWVQKDS